MKNLKTLRDPHTFTKFLLVIILGSFTINGICQKDILLSQTLYSPANTEAGDWIGHAKLNINEDYDIVSFSIEENPYFQIDNSGLITAKSNAIISNTLLVNVITNKWKDHAFITIEVSEKSNSIFIDPNASNSNGEGTRENPITSWDKISFASNTSYFFKRGTEINAPATLIDDQPGILFGAYGSGEKPVINFDATINSLKLRNCDGYVLTDLELTSAVDPNRILESYSHNFTINNCIISRSGMGMRGNGDNGKIVYTTFHDVGRDGIYLSNNALNLEIGNCHFYNINMRYMDNEPNTGYGEATGDAIQLESINCTGARIHHNIMDRHNTGHKFNLIINGFRDGVPSTDIIIEHNVSIGPKTTVEQPGSAFFISSDGPITRYNKFIDAPTAYTNRSGGNTVAHHNIISNCMEGFAVGLGSMAINNNVFYNTDYCVSMWPKEGQGYFINNIVYFNSADQSVGRIYNNVDISNNLFNLMPIDDNPSEAIINNGENLPVQDPKLTNPRGGNFYPQPNSPAIDNGVSIGYQYDFEGRPIPQSGSPDLGIYEFNPNDTSHVNDPVNTNRRPTANAGTNKTVNSGTVVTLDASKSSDPDNDVLSYIWTAPGGITLSSANSSKPTFTAPSPAQTTDYKFTLKVFDGEEYSLPVTVTITVLQHTNTSNNQPVAHAGNDQTVNPGILVTLDASKSSDPDSDVLSSIWTAPSGITLSLATAIRPTFTAPDPDKTTTYTFTLKVFDGNMYSLPDTVNITVTKEQLEEAQKLEVKDVEASAHDGNVPENTIDESLNTRWSAEGEGENITYELTGMDKVKYIKASFYKGDVRKAYFGVKVSNDGINWKNVLESTESSGETESFQVFDIENVDARFIRVIGYGNSENKWNSINEFEIYGVPGSTNIMDSSKKTLKAYPNPTKGTFKLDLSNIMFTEGSIHVYNMLGSLIYKKEGIASSQAIQEITLEGQPSGMYIVKFNSGINAEYISKILLQNPNY